MREHEAAEAARRAAHEVRIDADATETARRDAWLYSDEGGLIQRVLAQEISPAAAERRVPRDGSWPPGYEPVVVYVPGHEPLGASPPAQDDGMPTIERMAREAGLLVD